MLEKIKSAIERIDQLSKAKPLKVISHYDTDGITSAAIFSRALYRWGKKFTLEIVKGLDENYISALSDKEVLIFLDLASGSLDYLKKKNTEVFVFDHHEVIQEIPANVFMVNPSLEGKDMLSGAGVSYLFAKTLSSENQDLATLAVIGMVGDLLEKELSKTYDEILGDAECTVKKGLLLYPSTRPLDRALEYSSNPYIPGVTGSHKGVMELLRDANLARNDGRFKALYELSEEEMRSLITAIMLRFAGEYKQQLMYALKYVEASEKISGSKYLIINAKNNIKDTLIGTVASIISHSPIYSEGTIIVALAYNEDKIKVSARITGKEGRNVREVLNKVVVPIGGEVGGHPNAAGCLISKEHEDIFMEGLKKALEAELIRAQ